MNFVQITLFHLLDEKVIKLHEKIRKSYLTGLEKSVQLIEKRSEGHSDSSDFLRHSVYWGIQGNMSISCLMNTLLAYCFEIILTCSPMMITQEVEFYQT